MGESLRDRIIKTLRGVIDPETFQDVWSMKLVRDLKVTPDGAVSFTFRPSSVTCPLGFTLAARIKEAIGAVEGVKDVSIKVEGFVYGPQLERLLEDMDERRR